MALSYRERVLWEIAERYHEFTETLVSAGIPGNGETFGVLEMPDTYTPTVREFERLLGVMHNQAKQKSFRGVGLGRLRWHLLEWHLKAERVIRREPVTAKKNGKVVVLRDADGLMVVRPVIGFRRHRDAREERARDAVAWMAENWGLFSEPMLPGFEERVRAAA